MMISRHQRRQHRHSRCPATEPLRSTLRDDGIWESIETDDDRVNSERYARENEEFSVKNSEGDSIPAARPYTGPQHHNVKSTATQTSPTSPPVPDTTAPRTGVGHPAERSPTPTRADLIARVLHCPLPHPGLDPHGPVEPLPSPTRTASPPRRRRGRPKKAARRRRARFSDPAPPGAEPELASRDSHVFVRLVRVLVDVEAAGAAPRRRHEFAWNNRIKGWKPSDRRSGAGFFQLLGLFESPSTAPGTALRPVVLPVEEGGVRQPVETAWHEGRSCFIGVNEDGETLSVTMGEMKDAVRDPWARQFVGYVMR